MNLHRRELVALGAMVLIAPNVTVAQAPGKVYRLACMWQSSPALSAANVASFMDGLHDLGFIEGKNLVVDTRWAEGVDERFPQLAAELVALRPDIIVLFGKVAAIKAAQQATSTIPIVFIAASNPAGAGLVKSLAHPGGNTTGTSAMHTDLVVKNLEILRTLVPNATRIAVLQVNNIVGGFMLDLRRAAKDMRISLVDVLAPTPASFEQAVALMMKQKVNAVLVTPNAFFAFHRKKLADLLLTAKLPAIYPSSVHVDAGGLIAYGANVPLLYRRGADYVGKILNGTKPADLPVEQATAFELVVNLKTAKAIGITIPPSIMLRVDRVIE